MERFTGLIGLAVLMAIAYALSVDRRRISPRIVVGGVLLQFAFAFLFLQYEPVAKIFEYFAELVTTVISFANEGTAFIFGDKLTDAKGPWGFIFAVKVLPVIVFFASLMTVLYHLRIMQVVVAGVAWVLRRTMGVTGAEAISAAANIFLGQTEAPLLVKPYIAGMTRSQIMAVMVGGFATIAGSVMAAYIGILGGEGHEQQVLYAKHLMTASVMSAPAGFVMAKIMMPELESPRDESLRSLLSDERTTRNLVDAAASGATDGLRLALNVAAMLVAFVSLLAMANWPLQALSGWGPVAEWRAAHGVPVLSLQTMLGWVFTPLAWTMGVEWKDCGFFGSLLGHQLIATEFIAYLKLGAGIRDGTVGPRAAQIATYALCGFANFPSIAIQIGGLSGMAPERRADFATLGLRAMTAGALACWMTGAIASVFIA
jgi:CNT family concentrative nucleoside transporter